MDEKRIKEQVDNLLKEEYDNPITTDTITSGDTIFFENGEVWAQDIIVKDVFGQPSIFVKYMYTINDGPPNWDESPLETFKDTFMRGGRMYDEDDEE